MSSYWTVPCWDAPFLVLIQDPSPNHRQDFRASTWPCTIARLPRGRQGQRCSFLNANPQNHITRWWIPIFFLIWGNDPNLTSIFFQMGWFNHQLVKIAVDVSVIFYPEDDSSSPKIIHGGMSWIKPRANAENAERLFFCLKRKKLQIFTLGLLNWLVNCLKAYLVR